MQLSPCFGTYSDSDETCNGLPGSDGLDGQPCAPRVRCYALTMFCVEAGVDRAVHIGYQMTLGDPTTVKAAVPHRLGELDELVEAYIREHRVGVEDGVVRSGAYNKSSVYGNRRWRAPKPFPTPWLRSRVTGDMFTAWREALSRYLPQYPLHVSPRAIVPGNIVEDDELRLKRRVTYRLQLRRNRRLNLAMLQPGARADVLVISLPLLAQDVKALDHVGMAIRRLARSRTLKSKVIDVDHEHVCHVCELLAVAVNRGIIDTHL